MVYFVPFSRGELNQLVQQELLAWSNKVLLLLCTMKPLNKGHVGDNHFVPYREVVCFIILTIRDKEDLGH